MFVGREHLCSCVKGPEPAVKVVGRASAGASKARQASDAGKDEKHLSSKHWLQRLRRALILLACDGGEQERDNHVTDNTHMMKVHNLGGDELIGKGCASMSSFACWLNLFTGEQKKKRKKISLFERTKNRFVLYPTSSMAYEGNSSELWTK